MVFAVARDKGCTEISPIAERPRLAEAVFALRAHLLTILEKPKDPGSDFVNPRWSDLGGFPCAVDALAVSVSCSLPQRSLPCGDDTDGQRGISGNSQEEHRGLEPVAGRESRCKTGPPRG